MLPLVAKVTATAPTSPPTIPPTIPATASLLSIIKQLQFLSKLRNRNFLFSSHCGSHRCVAKDAVDQESTSELVFVHRLFQPQPAMISSSFLLTASIPDF